MFRLARPKPDTHPGEADMSKDISGPESLVPEERGRTNPVTASLTLDDNHHSRVAWKLKRIRLFNKGSLNYKLKIALDENPEDSDLKMILGKRLGFFKELYHRDVDNAMVVFDKGNYVPEEAVKDNEVSKEKDDVPEKEKDDVPEKEKMSRRTIMQHTTLEMNKEKDIEKVVDQDLDKPGDIEKESEFGNKEVEKNTEDLIKGVDVQPEDSQDSQPGMEIGAGIQEENHEPVKNYETLDEADFPLTGLEDIESLKGEGRNLFDEKSTVQNVNEEDMILQDSLLNLPFLSTQELPKYVSPDAQAIVEKRQEDMLTDTLIFCGKETKTFDSIKSKLVKKNDGLAQCMKEKLIDEVKGKSDDFKGGHPTVKRK
ncbi:hypothetical protein Tco_0905276 [Tanacetum coccineum]